MEAVDRMSSGKGVGSNQPGRRKSLAPKENSEYQQSPSASSSRKTSFAGVRKDHSPSKRPWTIYDFTQNLVSVLNDPNPHSRKKDLTLFTKTYGEAFTKPPIPPPKNGKKVKLKYFGEYIENNRRSYANLKRNLDNCPASLDLYPLDEADEQAGDEHVFGRRSSEEKRKETSNNILIALKEVPQVFFRSDFSLTDPTDFASVLKITELEEEAYDKQARGKHIHQKKLQETFGHYLDLVELQLSRQISLRSESLFSALSVQQDLHQDVKDILSEVLKTRGRMSIICSTSCIQPLKVAQLKRKKHNYLQVYKKLKLAITVRQTQQTIELLLSANDFVGALDLIETTKEVLEEELKGLTCVKHLGPQLAQLEKAIANMMNGDFIKSAMSLLVDENSGADSNGEEGEGVTVEKCKDRLSPIVLGLIRRRKLSFLESYREEVSKLIKVKVKEIVRDFLMATNAQNKALSSEDSVGKIVENGTKDKVTSSLADQIRSMGFRDWALLLQKLFCSLTNVIGSLRNINEALCDILSSVIEEGSEKVGREHEDGESVEDRGGWGKRKSKIDSLSDSEFVRVKKEWDDIVCSAAEIAHTRIAKLFTVKEEQTQKLVLPDFVRLYKMSDEFIVACENLCGRQCHGLRGSLLSQVCKYKQFLCVYLF